MFTTFAKIGTFFAVCVSFVLSIPTVFIASSALLVFFTGRIFFSACLFILFFSTCAAKGDWLYFVGGFALLSAVFLARTRFTFA
jgi:hypothetical protein